MTTPASPSPLPLFYRSPMLLRGNEHGGFGLRRCDDCAFAAEATAVPLVASEFAAAGRHYPIVFAADESAAPLAVLGVAAGRNLFVDDGGRWRAGSYVPGYVRRYPYIAMAAAEGGPLMLGIDSASPRLVTRAQADGTMDADAFFTIDGQPTAASQDAMAFCEAYAMEGERTAAFVAALKANDLLVERTVRIRYDGLPAPADEADATPGAHAQVNGFRLVEEEAFRKLPAKTIATFHVNGWNDLVVLHLASQLSWQTLIEVSAPPLAEAA